MRNMLVNEESKKSVLNLFEKILNVKMKEAELKQAKWDTKGVNVNIRMYNFDDVQCTVIPSVAYGFVTGMNLQLC